MAGEKRSTQVLYREWRDGNAEAGQIMAQRFADWYYAISTSRLGETRGREPCEASCGMFGEGIVNIREGRDLVPWAHSVIQAQIEAAGSRATDGDEANAHTGHQKPKLLLAKARRDLSTEVALLEATYGGNASPDEIEQRAAPLGGMPLGVLKARYSVKRWLRDNADVPFHVAPDQPDLDRGPLPLYESNRMASKDEEVSFETWMISDIDLCKDIAEFAHFSIALRGGLPSEDDLLRVEAERTRTEAAAEAGGGVGPTSTRVGMAMVAGLGIGGLLLIAAAAAYFFSR
jgi:hypothetical protein